MLIVLAAGLLAFTAGCGSAAKVASAFVQDGHRGRGIVYYVGGAGGLGNVGFLSIPRGMQDAGFRGYVELVPWQGIVTTIDQMNITRNRGKGIELGEKIRRTAAQYPDAPISIIALSAGTGITTFALESLPEDFRVQIVVFLGCSMSARYDLTRALKRVSGRLFVFYSPDDAVLSQLVPYTGTVDRRDMAGGVAGIHGFGMPPEPRDDTYEEYRKVLNIAYEPRFADYGYDGGHMSSTAREFIARFVAPLILDRGNELIATATSPLDDPTAAPRPDRRQTGSTVP